MYGTPWPVGTVATTRSVRGSIRSTRSVNWLADHTEPKPMPIPYSVSPALMRACTRPEAGSIRTSKPRSRWFAKKEPNPVWKSKTWPPIGTRWTRRPDEGSIAITSFPFTSPTHTRPPAATTPHGRVPVSKVATTRLVAGSTFITVSDP